MPEEETLELETLAPDLDHVEAEPGVNGNGEPYTAEETLLDYQAIASEAFERAEYERLQAIYGTTEEETTPEETTLSVEEDFLLDSQLVEVRAASQLRVANPVMPEAKAYQLNIGGTTYYAWFPAGARLVVCEDGTIYNETGANITGIISNSLNGVNVNGYNDTITVAPLLSGSGNNNAYRYGSRVYTTHYYVSGSSLLNSTTYQTDVTCEKEPGAGYGFTNFQYVTIGILLILLFLLIVRFFRK